MLAFSSEANVIEFKLKLPMNNTSRTHRMRGKPRGQASLQNLPCSANLGTMAYMGKFIYIPIYSVSINIDHRPENIQHLHIVA